MILFCFELNWNYNFYHQTSFFLLFRGKILAPAAPFDLNLFNVERKGKKRSGEEQRENEKVKLDETQGPTKKKRVFF